MGTKRDGALTALQADIWLDPGCYPFGLADFVGYMLGSFYPAPNFEIKAREVLTFKQSVGAYRAPGGPTVVLALDCLMDELAQRLGIDPIDMRLKNVARAGDPKADGKPWPGIGSREVLEALRDHPAWKNREQARAAGRGVGIALGGWPGATEPAAALCSLNRDGLLHIHVGSVDVSGAQTGFTLMAAEAFGIAPEQVRVIFSDTQTAPYAGPSAGSKVTYTTGAAVVAAAREARQQTLAIASEELEAAVEDLEIVDGKVQVRGAPSKAITLSEVASKAMRFDGKYRRCCARSSRGDGPGPAFDAQLAEEVDARQESSPAPAGGGAGRRARHQPAGDSGAASRRRDSGRGLGALRGAGLRRAGATADRLVDGLRAPAQHAGRSDHRHSDRGGAVGGGAVWRARRGGTAGHPDGGSHRQRHRRRDRRRLSDLPTTAPKVLAALFSAQRDTRSSCQQALVAGAELLPESIRSNYEIHEWKHACAI
jgi:hypothetical protein